MSHLSSEMQYILVVVGLFIIPRVLQRFQLPSAITCVGLGAIFGMGFGMFHSDTTIPLLATFGIVSLFLFAGLEVEFSELRRGFRVLLQHTGVQTLLLIIASGLVMLFLGLEVRVAILFSLALLTPSTGFILDSLPSFGLQEERQFWVKIKAISSEVMALLILFVTVQSSDVQNLFVSSAALIAMIVVLPPIFLIFSKRIIPYAPKSEFTFLVVIALICAFITRHLGAYYLVGAFVVGVTAVRLKKRIPELRSTHVLEAIELFAKFFIPFYFFKAGLHLESKYFSLNAFMLGILFVVIAVPIRIIVVILQRTYSLQEEARFGFRVGLSLVPTLVFTIVIADILLQEYDLSPDLYGALIVFTLINTVLPGFILKAPPPEFDTPEVPDDEPNNEPSAKPT